MLDVGWSEMAIVAVIALFVIGPKELPRVLRQIGRYAGKVKSIAREFQSSIDDAVREAELDDVKNQIESVGRMDLKKSVSDAIDPDGELGEGMSIPRSSFMDVGVAKPKAPEPEADAGSDDDTPEETAAPAVPAPAPANPATEEASADTSKAGA
jgi:sec-independent protein translocase protein TatB